MRFSEILISDIFILILYSTLQETMSRADEELQGAEDKLNHLSMVKSKLEQTLDDLEDTLDREKRSKADAEKTMRKMETDMKVQSSLVWPKMSNMRNSYLKSQRAAHSFLFLKICPI